MGPVKPGLMVLKRHLFEVVASSQNQLFDRNKALYLFEEDLD